MKYLIKHCGVDVEHRSMWPSSVVRGMRASATNLWWAALRGRYNVKCLVGHGADVNTVQLDTGDTCVLTACSSSHFKIVIYLVKHKANILEPNYNGVTCLMSSWHSVPLCQFLIDHGADLNAQDIQLKTALHYAIQGNNFGITKLLLENGANPLLKSKDGDDALQMACLCSDRYAFEYLIQKYSYSKERIAEAYELMGSTLIEEGGNMRETLNDWRIALSIRNEDSNNFLEKKTIQWKDSCPHATGFNFVDSTKNEDSNYFEKKIILQKAASNQYATEFNSVDSIKNEDSNNYLEKKTIQREAASNPYATEFNSVEELEVFALDFDAMTMQSLLVRIRILGPSHIYTVSSLIQLWGVYVHHFKLQRCVDLFPYLLELCFKERLRMVACQAVRVLVSNFRKFYAKRNTLTEHIQFSYVYEIIRLLISKIFSSNESLKMRQISAEYQYCFDELLKALSYLLYAIYVIPKTSQEIVAMEQILHRIVCINPRTFSDDTILHLVVSRHTLLCVSPAMDIFPDAEVAELLLQCGADVKAVNRCLNTPLHVAAEASNYSPAVFNTLLKHGAHTDHKNKAGNTPFDVMKETDKFNVNPFQYTTLKCLAARKIMEKQVPFSGKVPAKIESFIRVH
ncbi:protein fem-1 homolog A-B-like [Uloborus diversus]|uniref:protein fem-1 homolog A-B-like n=1 Tax=Uloborus diversus TaxID=327109 RepID=UPI00240A955F|nr:protein fem-1 homolog A-B-like [Uloborus diversus]